MDAEGFLVIWKDKRRVQRTRNLDTVNIDIEVSEKLSRVLA